MRQAVEKELDHDFGATVWQIQIAVDDTMMTNHARRNHHLPHYIRKLNCGNAVFAQKKYRY